MILVDSRVGSVHLAEGLRAQAVPFEVTTLEYGDCAFLGNGPDDSPVQIGIELKNVPDLLNSMTTGRLAGHQVPGLVDRYGYVWLVVEGFYRARKHGGQVEVPRGPGWVPMSFGRRPLFWSDLEAFLTTLEVQAGVRVRKTRTADETIRFIVMLYRWWSKPYDAHTSLRNLQVTRPQTSLVREHPTLTRVRQVAACLPAIGWGRSKAIAETFGSIEQLTNADVAAWEAIDGIGPTIARNVHRSIREVIPKFHRQATSASRVSPKHRAADGGSRHSRQRPHKQLDAGQSAQRSVSTVGTRRRKSRRRLA